MIPIRDTTRSESVPIVTNLFIAVNVLIFLLQLGEGRALNEFIYTYGLVPARYSVSRVAAQFTGFQQVIPFITFMFLHGGFLHLIGNMWFLHIFGDNVEDRLGHFRYLIFYLLCGLSSGVAHLVINWHSQVPTIGASGAIAGIMGAYMVLYPKARVLTLIPLFFIPYFVEIPAVIFLGIWFLFQFMSAAAAPAQAGGVAWWAHVGGFIFGIIFLKLFDHIPHLGADRALRRLTKKRTSPRVHVVRPRVEDATLDLSGEIVLTKREVAQGARKLVAIGQGRRRRTVFVRVPPGVSEGARLRLKALGRQAPDGTWGDLYLTVRIK